MTARDFLLRLAEDGGEIVSSGSCDIYEIAQAQSCRRFYVDEETALGFVFRPKKPQVISTEVGG